MNAPQVVSPEQAVLTAQIEAVRNAYGEKIHLFPETFNFRTSKAKLAKPEAAVDAEGNDILDEAGNPVMITEKTSKRPSIKLPLYRPSLENLREILNTGGPDLDLLFSAMEGVVYQRAYDILSENDKLTAADFPLEQLTWNAIATLPVETRSRGIDKDELKAFSADYIAVMPELTGKELVRVQNAARIFVEKFARHRTAQPILKSLREQLDIYTERAPNAAEFSATISWLSAKLDELLAVEDVTDLVLI